VKGLRNSYRYSTTGECLASSAAENNPIRQFNAKGEYHEETYVCISIGLDHAFGLASVAYDITNGQSEGNNHPYVGLIIFDDEDGPAWRCSGALIAPDVVLTAGHCTEGADGARVWFDEKLQDDDGNFLVPDYPWGGVVAVEGTP